MGGIRRLIHIAQRGQQAYTIKESETVVKSNKTHVLPKWGAFGSFT